MYEGILNAQILCVDDFAFEMGAVPATVLYSLCSWLKQNGVGISTIFPLCLRIFVFEVRAQNLLESCWRDFVSALYVLH